VDQYTVGILSALNRGNDPPSKGVRKELAVSSRQNAWRKALERDLISEKQSLKGWARHPSINHTRSSWAKPYQEGEMI